MLLGHIVTYDESIFLTHLLIKIPLTNGDSIDLLLSTNGDSASLDIQIFGDCVSTLVFFLSLIFSLYFFFVSGYFWQKLLFFCFCLYFIGHRFQTHKTWHDLTNPKSGSSSSPNTPFGGKHVVANVGNKPQTML